MKKYLFFATIITLFACKDKLPTADAYGNFEAEEIIVSAENVGKILQFGVSEGDEIKTGQVLGRIDSAQIVLKMEQLKASMRAISAKSPAIREQLNVFEKQTAAAQQQMSVLERERNRIQNLLKSDAATPAQLDDLNYKMEAIQKQLDLISEQRKATAATLDVQKGGILAELVPLQKQQLQLEDQLAKCRISAPQNGTVLSLYAHAGEMALPGKPLFKMADLKQMTLRAYITGEQITLVKIGQKMRIKIDGPAGQNEMDGTLTWVSAKAEFTPKVIQTREERVNLVYAVKISVPNDGRLKIGMPGEVIF